MTYPNTPSISVAGWDWVTFLLSYSSDDYYVTRVNDGHVSYGATDTGFCVEWQVREFPGWPSDLTTIKLTVDTTQLPTWSGTVETSGWLPSDLRRGIRFAPGEDVVTISSAFVVNGGRPVEHQSCPDGSVIAMNEVCPAEPTPTPSVTCWDSSLVFDASSCPAEPTPTPTPSVTCWDSSVVDDAMNCAAEPTPTPTPTPSETCWDGSVVDDASSCPAEPVQCWDGSSAPDYGSCPAQPITCWDGSWAFDYSSCPAYPPYPVQCWDGSYDYYGCPPYPVDQVQCWDGSSAPTSDACPDPAPVTYPADAIKLTVGEDGGIHYTAPVGKRIKEILFASYGTPVDYQLSKECHAFDSLSIVKNAVANDKLDVVATNTEFGDPCNGTEKTLSVVLTLEDDPTYVPPAPLNNFILSVTQARTAAWVNFALPALVSGRYDRVAYSVDGGRWISWGLYAKSAQRIKGLKLGHTYSIRIKAHVKRGTWTGASAPVDIAMKRIVHGVLVP